MSDSIAVIFCTEKGYLEKYSVLLAESIRHFGGDKSSINLYSFSPRKENKPSAKTFHKLKVLGVHIIDENLNTEYIDYPLANKPLICAWAENNLLEETVVFLDSDQIILGQPDLFFLNDEIDLRLRVVDRKGIGNGINDEISPYWASVCNELNVNLNYPVTTSVGEEEIYGYWNSGMIISNKATGVFTQWLENFRLLMSKGIHPKEGMFYLEQSSFAATVQQLGSRVENLPKEYNYPICLQDNIPSKNKLNSLSELISAHYHHIFTVPLRQNPLPLKFENDADNLWLNTKLKQHDFYPQKLRTRLSFYINKAKKYYGDNETNLHCRKS